LIGSFYAAIVRGGHSPVSPQHLLRVTEIYEELIANLKESSRPGRAADPVATPGAAVGPEARTVVLTGARGFLGSRIAQCLAAAGYRVRGISRVPDLDQPHVHEWVAADLAATAPPEAFAGAEAVVHAAAETSGGFDAHRRNTIDVTRNVLRAMEHAGVTRLVHVSSLSVLQPALFRRLHERSPLVYDPRAMGPYTWGKCLSEVIVRFEARTLGVDVRVVRPGTLVDLGEPEVPGLLGRRLFGRWHLGLGWPGLRIPVCPVDRCAAAIAWCVSRFDEAPRWSTSPTARSGAEGGCSSCFAPGAGTAAWHGCRSGPERRISRRPHRLGAGPGGLLERRAVWSVLRPQRYDTSAAETLFAAVTEAGVAPQPEPAPVAR